MTGDLTFFKTNAVNYYGVFCEEFDKSNPYTDVLANTRKKYFETHTRQKDKFIKRVDAEQYRYQFTLDEDHPLKWKVFTDTHILEKTVVSPDESYYVEVKNKYNDLQKRIYFGCFHNWQKTQYFKKGYSDPSVELVAWDFNSISVILRYQRDIQKPEVLYPCAQVSDRDDLEAVMAKAGSPDVAALCSMGFVYFAPKEISRKWNSTCEEMHISTAQKGPMEEQNKNSDKKAAVTPIKSPIKLELPKKKRIDLTQTREFIIPEVKKHESIVIPPILHTPDAKNIQSGSTADKLSGSKHMTMNEPTTKQNTLHSRSLENSPKEEKAAPSRTSLSEEPISEPAAPKLHSEMLINYTDDNIEPVKGGKIPSPSFDYLTDSKSVLDVTYDRDGEKDEEIDPIESIMQDLLANTNSTSDVDSDSDEDADSVSASSVGTVEISDMEITQEITPPTEDKRNENIAQRARENTIEEVKRAYNMKKVQTVTEAPKRTVPVDKIISVSQDEMYYYFGELKDGKRNGKGRTMMPNGNTAYEGGYLDDKRDGFGVYYYKTGKISYAGEWSNNRRNGVGVEFVPSDNSLYVGGWENNCPVGMGAKFDSNGNLSFAGYWDSGTKDGLGITYNPKNGSLFVSRWEEDVMSNRGTLFDENGILTYNGTVKKGKRHGYGTSYDERGQVVYSGGWSNNIYSGKGTLNLANGFKIEGSFENGKVNGHATATNRNGTKLYEGEWVDNRYNGEGKLYMPDGSWCQGQFEKGEPKGILSGYSKDGVLLYKGEWRDGRFHGKGICYDNGEKIYEGELDNGIRSGSGHEYIDGKCVYIGSFEENSRSGFGTSYDNNGEIEYSGQWSNGVYDGFGLLYVSGEPRYAGQFVSGTLHGRINEIFNNRVIKECIYSEGECVYMREFTDDGLTLKYDGNVKNGMYEGMGCGFSPYGEKYFEGIFKKNEPFKNMKVSLRKLEKLEYCDEISKSQYNKFIKGPSYVVEEPYNGGTYSGLLHNNKPEGKGTILYSDHGYTGSFSNGTACGLGVIYEWDGSEITGTFVTEAGENTTEITLDSGITYHLLNTND
ncbi:MAG: hypothetical protein K2M82_05980 [Lachnospiraceae bacterium]|nr:hypothetical protein [Lachnospiraceae bacterium]